MTRSLRLLQIAARFLTLAGALWLLVAESPPADDPRCGQFTPPQALRSQGTCGPEGIIVVNVSRWRGELWLENSEMIGLPRVAPVSDDPNAYYAPDLGGGHGQYLGNRCPFDVSAGNWEVYGRERAQTAEGADSDAGVRGADGGGDAGNSGGGNNAPWDKQDVCKATYVLGKIELKCSYQGRPTCQTTLTPI